MKRLKPYYKATTCRAWAVRNPDGSLTRGRFETEWEAYDRALELNLAFVNGELHRDGVLSKIRNANPPRPSTRAKGKGKK